MSINKHCRNRHRKNRYQQTPTWKCLVEIDGDNDWIKVIDEGKIEMMTWNRNIEEGIYMWMVDTKKKNNFLEEASKVSKMCLTSGHKILCKSWKRPTRSIKLYCKICKMLYCIENPKEGSRFKLWLGLGFVQDKCNKYERKLLFPMLIKWNLLRQ